MSQDRSLDIKFACSYTISPSLMHLQMCTYYYSNPLHSYRNSMQKVEYLSTFSSSTLTFIHLSTIFWWCRISPKLSFRGTLTTHIYSHRWQNCSTCGAGGSENHRCWSARVAVTRFSGSKVRRPFKRSKPRSFTTTNQKVTHWGHGPFPWWLFLYGCWTENRVFFLPKSSIFNRVFHEINHPLFWVPLFLETPISTPRIPMELFVID